MGFFSFGGNDRDEEFTNDNYHVRYNNLKSQYDYAIKEKNYCMEQWSKLSICVQSLCKEILSNRYNTSQISGDDTNILSRLKDVYELIEFTKEDFRKQKTDFIEMITTLSKQVESQKLIISTLKDEYEKMALLDPGDVGSDDLGDTSVSISDDFGFAESNNILSEFSMDEPVVQPTKTTSPISNPTTAESSSTSAYSGFKQPTIKSNFGNNKNNNRNESNRNDKRNNSVSNNNKDNSPKQNFTPNTQQNNVPNTQNIVKTNTSENAQGPSKQINILKQNDTQFSIESIQLAMNDLKWAIVEVIGTTGYARSNDIYNEISKRKDLNYKVSLSTIQEALNSLNGLNILLCEKVRISMHIFNVYSFKDAGVELFKSRFNKVPVESERDKKIRDHDNLQHGYAITMVYDSLLSPTFNCDSVTMDRKETSIKLPKGKTYIPDIIAVKDDEKMYIEVELGNTHQNDFNDKCNKMFEITKNFYFVTDVASNIGVLQSSIDKWIMLEMHGVSNVSGLLVRITTITQFKKGEWMVDKTY